MRIPIQKTNCKRRCKSKNMHNLYFKSYRIYCIEYFSAMTWFYFVRIFVLLKPDVIHKMGEILKIITNHDFLITNIKMMQLTPDEVVEYYVAKDITDKT